MGLSENASNKENTIELIKHGLVAEGSKKIKKVTNIITKED